MRSFSEISTYLECQRKWDFVYKKGFKLENIHFTFGNMGHKVLETRVIPEEDLYPELKDFFKIKSWHNYFTSIFDELDKRMSGYTLIQQELKLNNNILSGVIDAVWQNKETGRYLITDFKFATREKDIEDLTYSEQLYIYALLYAQKYNIPLDKIDISYISIPKTELDEPRRLQKGGLSKDKSQNVTYDTYLAKIKELGLNEADYTDILTEISGKTLLGIHLMSIDMNLMLRIMENIDNILLDMEKDYIIERFSYQCKYCQCNEICKKGEQTNA